MNEAERSNILTNILENTTIEASKVEIKRKSLLHGCCGEKMIKLKLECGYGFANGMTHSTNLRNTIYYCLNCNNYREPRFVPVAEFIAECG